MRSRAVRLTLLLLFVIAVGVTAYLFWIGESRARVEFGSARAHDDRMIVAARQIIDLRAAQVAYVAEGQGDEFWAQKVTNGLASLRDDLTHLKAESVSPEAHSAIDAAVSSLQDFEQMDRRARDYARGGQKLLASDIIFADGLALTGAAAASLDQARAAETHARTASLADVNRRQLFALGSAAAAALLVVILLVPQPREAPALEFESLARPAFNEVAADSSEDLGTALDEGWSKASPQPEPPPVQVPPAPSIDLPGIASLCTDLARLVDTRTMPSMLERAASTLDATGIVLWIADPDGRELSPIVTHGYAPNVVTRLGTILKNDQNATAAAFRTSLVQTVKTDTVSNGAIAAPLVTPNGCVGVMAAEVRHKGEQDAAKLATAAIVAAQLATLVGPPSARAQADPSRSAAL
jgi:hypothetical protein